MPPDHRHVGFGAGTPFPPGRIHSWRRRVVRIGLALAVLSCQGSASGSDAEPTRPLASAEHRAGGGTAFPQFRVVRRLDASDVAFPAISDVGWSPDGSEAAAYVDFGSTLLRVWDQQGKLMRELHRPEVGLVVSFPGFLHGTRQLVTEPAHEGGETIMSVLDVATGAVVRDVPGLAPCNEPHGNFAGQIVVSPDQSLVAVTCGFTVFAPAVLYSTRDWTPVAVLGKTYQYDPEKGLGDVPTALAFSHDGRILAVGTEKGLLLLYDTASWRLIHEYTPFRDIRYVEGFSGISFSPDAKFAVVATDTNNSIPLLPDGTEAPGKGVMTKTIVPDPVRVVRISDGAVTASAPGVGQPARKVEWDPAGPLIVLIGADNRPRLWRPVAGSGTAAVPFVGGASSANFSPDGALLAVAKLNRITILDTGLRHAGSR